MSAPPSSHLNYSSVTLPYADARQATQAVAGCQNFQDPHAWTACIVLDPIQETETGQCNACDTVPHFMAHRRKPPPVRPTNDPQVSSNADPVQIERDEKRLRSFEDTERRFENAEFLQASPSSIPAPTKKLTIGAIPMRRGVGENQDGSVTTGKRKQKNPVHVTAKLRVYIAGQHDFTSHVDLALNLEWPGPGGSQVRPQTTQVTLKIFSGNCQPDSLTTSELTEPFPERLQGLPEKSIFVGTGVNTVSVTYTAAKVWSSNLLGSGDFGEHQPTIDALRSFAVHGANITIVAGNSTSLTPELIDDLRTHWEAEASTDPYRQLFRTDITRLDYRAGEVVPLDPTNESVPPVSLSFRDLDALCTQEMVGLVRDHSAEEARSRWVRYKQRARFIGVPGHEHYLIMLIDEDSEFPLNIQDDELVHVRIHKLDESDGRENDWHGVAIPPLTHAQGSDRAFRIRRAWDKEAEMWKGADPSQLGDIAAMHCLTDVTKAQAILDSMKPHAVDIRVDVDQKSFRRREQTIRALRDRIIREQTTDPSGISPLGEVVLGSRFDRLVSLDLFDTLSASRLAELDESLHSSQVPIVQSMRTMPGGFQLVQGCAGAGKSRAIQYAIAALVRQQADKAQETSQARRGVRVLLVSPLNQNAEQNAVSIREILGDAPDAIIIRWYSKGATSAMFYDYADDADAKGEHLSYNHEAALAALNAACGNVLQTGPRAMLQQYKDSQKRFFYADKRVTQGGQSYSVASYAVLLAKLEQVKLPIHDAAIKRLRLLVPEDDVKRLYKAYRDYRDAAEPDPEQRRELTIALKAVSEGILQAADVVATTCQLAADSNLWLLYRPELFVCDEAAKATSADSLVFAWYPTCRYHILVGDSHQSQPQVRSSASENVFCMQMTLSLFTRLRLCGFPSANQFTQFRYHSEVSELVSEIFYNGQLLNGPVTAVAAQEIEATVQCIETAMTEFRTVKSTGPVWILDLRNTTMNTSAVGKSKFNSDTAKACWVLIEDLIGAGITAAQIGIVTPYVAQRTMHETIRNRRINMEKNSTFWDMMIETSERAQGLERPVIIYDIPNTDKLSLAGHTPNLCTGITRCRSGLFFVCDIPHLESTRDYSRKAIGRALNYLRKKKKTVLVNPTDLPTPDWFCQPKLSARTERGQLQDAVEPVTSVYDRKASAGEGGGGWRSGG